MWSPRTVQSYCINLDRRTDRWAHIQSIPEVQKIPNLQRVSAVDGGTIDIPTETRISTLCRYNIMNKTRRAHDMLDSAGGVGCALSHIQLWQQLLKSDQEVFLILEDDILIEDGDYDKICDMVERTPFLQDPTQWDIWTIGNIRCLEVPGVRPPGWDKKENKWIQCREFLGMNTYFITRRAAERLLKEAFPIQHHIDWYISFYARNHKDFVIHYNKMFNNKQIGVGGAGSDIQWRKQCHICNIPSNVEDTHYYMRKENMHVIVLGALCVGVLAAYTVFRRQK